MINLNPKAIWIRPIFIYFHQKKRPSDLFVQMTTQEQWFSLLSDEEEDGEQFGYLRDSRAELLQTIGVGLHLE